MNNTVKHNFSKLALLLVVLFMGIAQTAEAQQLANFYLKYKEGSNTFVAGNTQVYSFQTRAQAERAARSLSEGGVKAEKLAGYIDGGKTASDDGWLGIKVTKDGGLVIDPINIQIKGVFLEVEAISVAKYSDAQGDIHYTVGANIKQADNGEKTTEIENITVKDKLKKNKAQGMVTPKACGNSLFFGPQPILVDSAWARDNGRFIVAPVIYIDGKLDTPLLPTVLDGKSYRETQERRMQHNMKNDKLFPYVANHFMQDYKGDTVYTQEIRIENFDKTKKYKGVARMSYENYNVVYHEDAYEWWDGRVKDPMRFLDWDHVKKSVPIEATRYRKIGRAEKSTLTIDGLTVNYPVGSSDIDMTDSVTLESIETIQKSIMSYYGDDDSFIEKMVIKGYASPEGGYAKNQQLCEARAATLERMVRNKYGRKDKLQSVSHKGYVAPWTEVAKYIEEHFGGDEEKKQVAAEMNEIINANSGMDAQYAKIRVQPWYEFVKNEVLPHMRRVDVEFSTVTSRVKDPDEIYECFITNPDYLNAAKPYEYYELLKRFGEADDMENLEKVAKKAYGSVTETVVRHDRQITDYNDDGSIDFYLKPSAKYTRKYPLAAYNLARCKFMRHEIDTVMLNDYIDWSNNGLELEKQYGGQDAGFWNDEAIVVMQVLMYCEAHDYLKAKDLCTRHLSDNPRYDELKMFVRCMNCEWDNPEVRAFVAASSPLNNAVVTMAQDTPDDYVDALNILTKDPAINQQDPNVQYMKAICRFQAECDNTRPDADPYFAGNIYKTEDSDYKDFAAPILEAFKMAPNNVKYIETDGYFNDSYRLLSLFFWKRMQEGADLDSISMEYNGLRSKFMTAKNKDKK